MKNKTGVMLSTSIMKGIKSFLNPVLVALLLCAAQHIRAVRPYAPDDPVKPLLCTPVDTAPIRVYADRFDALPNQRIRVDNSAGKSPVNYRASIRFTRSITDWEGISDMEKAYGSTESESSGENSDPPTQFLQHERIPLLSYAFGLCDSLKTQTFASKYRAGATGFSVSSVGTWFTGEVLSEGVIRVEIRAGGRSVEDAVPLAEGSLPFSVSENEENGKMYAVPLSRPAAVYPGEDFYLLVTYPARQKRPQGCAMNQSVAPAPGRYLFKSGDTWRDLQREDGFANCAWLMSVTETKPDNIAWLQLSAPSGVIRAGAVSYISLAFAGTPQLKGERKAEVFLTLDDSCGTAVAVPVTLHVNEAPFFLHAPREIYVPENFTRQYEIELYDNENDAFAVQPLEGAKVVTHAVSGSRLTLTVAPRTGETGHYRVKFRIVDEHGESRDLTVPVHVTTLEPLFAPEDFIYSFREERIVYDIHELFRYLNGDGFSFIASAEDENVVKLQQPDDSTMIVFPVGLGSTGLNVIFRDHAGNEFYHRIPVSVGLCEDASRTVVQKWDGVLFVNNAANRYSSEGYQWYRNGGEIPGATGQYYSAGDGAGDMLDFSASYYVRMVTVEGDTVYSCPLVPVRRDTRASIHPNPVAAGAVLHIETGFADTEGEVRVRLIDLSGRIVQTDVFRGASGSFRTGRAAKGYCIVVVSGKRETKSFRIHVK